MLLGCFSDDHVAVPPQLNEKISELARLLRCSPRGSDRRWYWGLQGRWWRNEFSHTVLRTTLHFWTYLSSGVAVAAKTRHGRQPVRVAEFAFCICVLVQTVVLETLLLSNAGTLRTTPPPPAPLFLLLIFCRGIGPSQVPGTDGISHVKLFYMTACNCCI